MRPLKITGMILSNTGDWNFGNIRSSKKLQKVIGSILPKIGEGTAVEERNGLPKALSEVLPFQLKNRLWNLISSETFVE